MKAAWPKTPSANQVKLVAAAVGLVGLVLLVVLAYFDLTAALWGWLVAVQFWIALPLGAFGVLMMHCLTGGAWGTALQPLARSTLMLIPLFAVALLPLLIGLDRIMSWTAPVDTLSEVVANKRFYLNLPFFWGRNIAYALIWLLFTWKLGVWSRRSMSPGGAAAGLLLWLLTLTYFTVDWIQALEPEWYTDILGMIYAAETGTTFMALAILSLSVSRRMVEGDHKAAPALQDMAAIWLAGIVGWILLMFSQYIIMWSGNLPREVDWFIHRFTPGWYVQMLLAFALYAVIPFFALLSGAVRSNPRWLAWLAAGQLLGQLLLVDWSVTPSLHQNGWQLSWPALLAWVALGGVSVALGLHNLHLTPPQDALLSEAAR